MKTEDLTQNDIIAIEQIISEFPPYGEHEIVIEDNQQHLIDLGTNAIQYLINNGFAIKRSDLRNGNCYQLTERGRDLKNIGNLNAFYSKEKDIISEKYRQGQRDIYLFWVNFWIAVGAVFASLYYILEIAKNHYCCYYDIFQHYIFPIIVILSIVLMIISIWKIVKNLLLK